MSIEQDLQQLRILAAELTQRVGRLEQKLGVEPHVQRSIEMPRVETPAPEPPMPESRLEPPLPVPRPAPAPPHPVFDQRTLGAAVGTDDLEQKIGSQWMNRIGIVAVLISASYFLKFAFDNGWIGPAGRVALGLLAGMGIVLWSERFRRKAYVGFSYSLKALGIGVLYLSLWAASQLYQLIPSGVAFLAMTIITTSTAVMAITRDAEILAALALLGGFITPALVSTGENHEVVLFSYVAMLDLALLAMLVYRPWRRLLSGGFAGTVVMYVGWYGSFYTDDQLAITWLFATIFLLIFATAPLVVNTRIDSSPQGSPILIIVVLLNAATYFIEVLVLLNRRDLREYRSWVAVALAALYILLGRRIADRVKRDGEDKMNCVFPPLHTGIAVALLTEAIPLMLNGRSITLGWLIEAAVLFFIGMRTRASFMKILALTSLGLGLARLVTIDYQGGDHLIFNQRFGMYLVAIAVIAFVIGLQRRDMENATVRSLVGGGVVIMNLLALVALCLEVHAYWERLIAAARPTGPGQRSPIAWHEVRSMRIAREFSYSAVWMSYGAVLMVVGFWKKQPFLRWQAIVLIGATIAKVFLYDVSALDRAYRILSFLALGVILLAISFLYQRDILRLRKS